MLNVDIDEKNIVIVNSSLGKKWTINTSEAFGLFMSKLENHFPGMNTNNASSIIAANIVNKFNNANYKNVDFFGIEEYGQSLYQVLNYIDSSSATLNNQTFISPEFKKIEEMRISNNMNIAFLYKNTILKEGMSFTGLKSLTEVIIALLFFYSYNDYKIIRCAHCGKWFATKSLKNKYCNRISPCFDSIITGKEELSCYDAVQNIRQKCARIRKKIRDNTIKTASFERRENTFLLAFEKDSEIYFEPGSQTAKPDSQNLLDYYNFLKTTHQNKEWLK